MRNSMLIAVLAVAGLCFVSFVHADDPVTPGARTGQVGQDTDRAADRAEDAIRRTHEGTVQAPDAEGIRDVLAQVAEASVTKGGLNDMVERFVDADRNRLGEGDVLTRDDEQLDGIIAQFQKNWEQRYSQEFDIKDEDQVFTESFARIMQGEIGDTARLARERRPGEPGALPDVRPGPESDRIAGGDTNREPGREVASVVIAESHGLPALHLPMIKEMPDSWKIDVPETMTAQQFRDNLGKALTELNEQQAQWPADVNDAYRHVTHRILLVVMNKDTTHEGMQDPNRLGVQPEQDQMNQVQPR